MAIDQDSAIFFYHHEERLGRHDPLRVLSQTSSHQSVPDNVLASAAIRSSPITLRVAVQMDDIGTANGLIFEYGDATTGLALALDGGDLIVAAGAQGDDGADGTATVFAANGQIRSFTVAAFPGTGQLQVWERGIRVIDETAVAGSFAFWAAAEPDAGITNRIPALQRVALTGATIVTDIFFATKQLPKQFRR